MFPPMALRFLVFLEESEYSPAVRNPSGSGVRTAHTDSITGGAPGIIVDGEGVSTGKLAGSTRSFVPITVTADASEILAATVSPGIASGAMSYESHRVLGEPVMNWRLRARLAFPVPSNRAFARRRSTPG